MDPVTDEENRVFEALQALIEFGPSYFLSPNFENI
jgi:hypothetical protein